MAAPHHGRASRWSGTTGAGRQPALRTRLARRHAPAGDLDWIGTCQAAYATAAAETYARTLDLARRAEAVTRAMHVVRTKGAVHSLAALLADVVVAATHLTGLGF